MKKFSKWLKKYFIPHEANEFKPHFLRHQTMLGFFFLVIILELGFLVQVFVVFDKTKFLAEVLPAVLENLTNQERAQNNISPLKENALLDKAAQEKAEDMAKNGYFAHTSPEGKTPWYWFDQVGYNYIYAGENLAVNFFESNDVAQAWMNSPTHRANILKSDYTEIGIGVAQGVYEGRNTVFVAQLFGKPLVFSAAVETPQVPKVNNPTKSTSNVKAVASTPPTTSSERKPAPTTENAPENTAGSKTTSQNPTSAKTSNSTENPTKKVAPSAGHSTPQATTQTESETPEIVPTIINSIPTPTSVKVLGEESTTNTDVPIVTTRTLTPQSSFKSFIERILTAPRTTLTYVYEALGLLVLLALIIAFAMSERHHKKVMARGFALIAIILTLSYVNLQVLNIKTKVPNDDHNMTANVINAFPK